MTCQDDPPRQTASQKEAVCSLIGTATIPAMVIKTLLYHSLGDHVHAILQYLIR